MAERREVFRRVSTRRDMQICCENTRHIEGKNKKQGIVGILLEKVNVALIAPRSRYSEASIELLTKGEPQNTKGQIIRNIRNLLYR